MDKLCFYIRADRIMNGFPEKPSWKELFFRFLPDSIVPSPYLIIDYLRNMRIISERCGKKRDALKLYHKYRFNTLGRKLGFSIGCNVFGYGLVIPHYGLIVVNGNNEAGNFCVLHTGTCIAGGGKKIGNSLYMSAGSKISGEVTLGNNITLAINSVCISGSTDDELLVGIPAKCKKHTVPWYIRDGIKYKKRHEKVMNLFVDADINDLGTI